LALIRFSLVRPVMVPEIVNNLWKWFDAIKYFPQQGDIELTLEYMHFWERVIFHFRHRSYKLLVSQKFDIETDHTQNKLLRIESCEIYINTKYR
jgi:hypothetical protein